MIELSKTIRFEAAHRLTEHDGKCRRLHGHSWIATVILRADDTRIQTSGPKRGMLVDFTDVKAPLKQLRDDYLDHHYLNDTLDVYPTSEHIARWLYRALVDRYDDTLASMLHGVVIEETCTSSARYVPEA